MGSTLHIASVTKPVPRSAVANASGDEFTEDARRASRDAEPARAAGVRVETHAVMGAPAHTLVEPRRRCTPTSWSWATGE